MVDGRTWNGERKRSRRRGCGKREREEQLMFSIIARAQSFHNFHNQEANPEAMKFKRYVQGKYSRALCPSFL